MKIKNHQIWNRLATKISMCRVIMCKCSYNLNGTRANGRVARYNINIYCEGRSLIDCQYQARTVHRNAIPNSHYDGLIENSRNLHHLYKNFEGNFIRIF